MLVNTFFYQVNFEMAELDEAKIREAVKKAEKIDVKSLFRAFTQMLRVYGEMGKKIGTIQKDNKDAFEALIYLGSIAPQFMQILAKKAPPAELGAFIKAFLELLELAPKLENLMKLSAEEKIQVGERLEKIADTLEEMFKKIEEESNKGEE